MALQMLRVRDRFEAEIRTRCDLEGFPSDEALEWLRSRRLVDDFRVARDFAQKACRNKLWAHGRIRAEIVRRSDSEEAADAAVAGLPPEIDTARRLIRKLGSVNPRKLANAGFDEDTITALSGPLDG
jgi:SOS response regulatory protein OraA/RecX